MSTLASLCAARSVSASSCFIVSLIVTTTGGSTEGLMVPTIEVAAGKVILVAGRGSLPGATKKGKTLARLIRSKQAIVNQ